MGPRQVTGECDTKEFGSVDDLQGFSIGKAELRQEIVLLGQVEGHDLGLLHVDLHLVLVGKI